MIIYYTVPEIWCLTDVVFVFHFGLFFYHFTHVYQKVGTDRQTDGRTERVTYKGGCPT